MRDQIQGKKLRVYSFLSYEVEITSEGTGTSYHSSKTRTRVDVYDSCIVYIVAF